MQTLRGQLPEGMNLSELRIAADGDSVIVRGEDAAWSAESGQILFDFSTGEMEARIATLQRVSPDAEAGRSADDWFSDGWELEPSSSSDAEAAYRRAIELDPSHTDARLNLGRLLHESGRLAEAEEHYRRACETADDDPLPWFNLGVLMEDTERLDEAISSYRRAIEVDPTSADAHYNLGGVYERVGRPQEAIRHLAQFRRLAGREE